MDTTVSVSLADVLNAYNLQNKRSKEGWANPQNLWNKCKPMLSLRDELGNTQSWVFCVGLIGIALIILDLFGVIICLAYFGIMGEWPIETDQITSIALALFLTGFAAITFVSFVED